MEQTVLKNTVAKYSLGNFMNRDMLYNFLINIKPVDNFWKYIWQYMVSNSTYITKLINLYYINFVCSLTDDTYRGILIINYIMVIIDKSIKQTFW